MTAFGRLGTAAAAAWLAIVSAPATAQVAVDPSAPAENAVGPAQLRDFSLDGTVIRRSEQPPERTPAASAPRQQPAEPTAQARAESAPAPAQPTRQVAQRSAQQAVAEPASERASSASAAPAGDLPFDLGTPSPAEPLISPAPAIPASSESLPDSSFAPASGFEDRSGFSPLPWILAILAAGGAAFFYFRRQRSPLAFAGAAGVSEFAAPEPAPAPRPAPPRAASPAPAPAPPSAPVGIVSTRLRPWLDVQFAADKVTIDGDRALVEFEVAVMNSGSGPAREVLVEAAMFNAGPEQDKEVGAFFARPVGQGERVPMIAPLKNLGFRSAVSLTREQLRLFKAGDRTVFIPLVGINVLYSWSGGEAQTSVGFLVGRQTQGEKLAPFSVDQARTFSGLGARELDVRVRK